MGLHRVAIVVTFAVDSDDEVAPYEFGSAGATETRRVLQVLSMLLLRTATNHVIDDIPKDQGQSVYPCALLFVNDEIDKRRKEFRRVEEFLAGAPEKAAVE